MSNFEDHDRNPQLPYIDPALVIDTRLREIERQQREDKAEQKKHDRSQRTTNWLLTIFTGLLFITSVVSDVLMLRYVDLTKQSADAATSAANIASKQLIGSQAATLDLITDLGEDGLHVSIANRGVATAVNVVLDLTVLQRFLPSGIERSTPQHYQFGPLRLIGGLPSAARAPFLERLVISKWTPRAFAGATTTGLTVRLEGSLRYDNGFGELVSTSFCKSYLGYRSINAAGVVVGTSAFIPCEGFDDAVKTSLQRREEEKIP